MNTFINGPISPELIAKSIAGHQSKTGIGAHNIFLGQVRADFHAGNCVQAIEFSTYEEMAYKKLGIMREQVFDHFDLTCMHIHHSLGIVQAGEICFFVFVSAPHREVVFKSIPYIVHKVKSEIPIFGKEFLDNETHQWKSNKLKTS